jgi:hypothetical protein
MKTKLILASLLTSNLIACAAGSSQGSLVAHEWGTFTSVQGADGVQIEWNPFITADLPKFVYNRHEGEGAEAWLLLEESLSKSSFVALQRMETPVIYFYGDQKTTVDVEVRFPQGWVTEWYPRTIPNTNRITRWSKLTIEPQANEAGLLPNDGSKSHYYAARETDAALIRVPTRQNQTEHEKFLFYRGVGFFQAPLRVTMSAIEDHVQLHNASTEELRHFFVLRVKGNRAGFARVKSLAPKESKPTKLDDSVNTWDRPLAEVRKEIGQAMAQALVSEGLYEREATAMIKTWEDSWFGEQGLRVLYVLPRAWTDRTLPLSIDPKPEQIVRVMVGRAEVITPSMEWELMKQIVKHAEGSPDSVGQFQKLGIGRFADAAVRRMLGRKPSPEFSRAAWNLLELGLRPPAQPKLAAK